jgi:hypothetical protein
MRPTTIAVIDRQILRATDLTAFGTKRFVIPFDAAGQSVGAIRGPGHGRERRIRSADLAPGGYSSQFR